MNRKLDYFGKILIENVRDRSINQMELRINGRMKDEDSKKIYSRIQQLNKEQVELIEEMIPKIIDLTLHNMLFMFEQYPEIKLLIEKDDLNEESDGLAGELYTEDGWIERFSKNK